MKKQNTRTLYQRNENSYAQTDLDKSECLNSFFASVFTKEDNEDPKLTNREFISQLSEIQNSEEDILKELSNLNCLKSAEPEVLHPRLLWQLRCAISKSLCHIFNLSILEVSVPTDWRTALLVPIYKKGDKSHC